MYESFGLIGIQLPEKYKENFDVSSEGPKARRLVLLVFVYIVLLLINIISSRIMSIIYFYALKFTFNSPVRIYGIRSVRYDSI